MSVIAFASARRETRSLTAPIERRCLPWIAARLPAWVAPDHLTALALVSMVLMGASYAFARANRLGLIGAVVCLALNWFGDSLDGTLARVRRRERPRYGFYVDHVVDCFGVLFAVAGLAVSGYMSPLVALSLLVAYFLLSIEVYLAAHCMAVFRLSFAGVGPTELRLLLATGTLALWGDPTARFLGHAYRLFDVGGAIATAGILAVVVVSVVNNVRDLADADRPPDVTARTA